MQQPVETLQLIISQNQAVLTTDIRWLIFQRNKFWPNFQCLEVQNNNCNRLSLSQLIPEWAESSVYFCVNVCFPNTRSLFSQPFSGGPGLAGTRMFSFWMLLELRMMEVVVTTGATRRAKLQSNCHHQQTNIQLFYRPDALPVAQPTVS